MARDEIEVGKEYFCREETSGKGLAGTFRIEESKIEARLHSFDKPFFLKQKSIVLRLENNRFVTLYDSYSSGGAGGSHDLREPKLSTYTCRVAANIAIIGRDSWSETDPIRQVHFDIAHTDDLLHHIKKFDAIADAKLGKSPDPTICELKVGGVKISAWYAASGSFDFPLGLPRGLVEPGTNVGDRPSGPFHYPARQKV